MPLPIEIRNAVRRGTQKEVDILIKRQVVPDPQSPKKWKFSNSVDFHYGHFVGMMEMNASTVYSLFYKKQPSQEEMKEIQEIIEEFGEPFRKYLQSLSKDA